MNVYQLLPYPHQLLRLGLSLLNAAANNRRAADKPSALDFDIDRETGFVPRDPLPKLPEGFAIWEKALSKAQSTLCLGEDLSDEAIQKRSAGHSWRSNIASVSNLFLNIDRKFHL